MAEQEVTVNKDAVKISGDSVTITDPKVVQQLKDRGLEKTASLDRPSIYIGVVIRF